MSKRRNAQRGAGMVEFVLVGIAAVALMITTVQMSIAMWNYHTLAYAVHETNRYIASHGEGCALGTNTCTITMSQIAQKLASNAIGLLPANLSMTLTPNSGSSNAVSCSPVSACYTNTTGTKQWPPYTNLDNRATQPPYSPTYTTIQASYSYNAVWIAMWYRTRSNAISTVTLTSQSQIPMLF
jgi:Flp pilus assembly protein TadG